MKDNFDDFDFEGFMEESNKEFDSKMEQWKERMVLQAIETNYNKILESGIDDWHVRHLDLTELNALNETLHFMIDHYVEIEEYEKCAVLKKEIKKIDEALHLTKNK